LRGILKETIIIIDILVYKIKKQGGDMTIWILLANSAEAKVLATDNLRVGELKLLREFIHPESRKKISELMTDKPGHYKTDTNAHSAYSKSNPKDVEVEHFALQLAHELKAGLDHNLFKKIIIIAPAHFYGVLKKHFDVPHHIEEVHILKDYTKYTLGKLHVALKDHLLV